MSDGYTDTQKIAYFDFLHGCSGGMTMYDAWNAADKKLKPPAPKPGEIYASNYDEGDIYVVTEICTSPREQVILLGISGDAAPQASVSADWVQSSMTRLYPKVDA